MWITILRHQSACVFNHAVVRTPAVATIDVLVTWISFIWRQRISTIKGNDLFEWNVQHTAAGKCIRDSWHVTRDSYCVTDDGLSEGVWGRFLHFLVFTRVVGACLHVSLQNNRKLSTLLRHGDNLKDSLIVNELQNRKKKKRNWDSFSSF
jgi:hypothetical protein